MSKMYSMPRRALLIAIVICLSCSAVFLASAASSNRGKIESGKPQYVKKGGGPWEKQGRIVGLAKKAPRFIVELRTTDGYVVKLTDSEKGGAYELEWLDPGTYDLRITAEGFCPLEMKRLGVKASYDLRIDLEFTKERD